jgi:hypothetical protein
VVESEVIRSHYLTVEGFRVFYAFELALVLVLCGGGVAGS